MLIKEKTHAIPLGKHVTQQKLTVIPARSSIFRYHSRSFHFILVLFRLIPACSVLVLILDSEHTVHFGILSVLPTERSFKYFIQLLYVHSCCLLKRKVVLEVQICHYGPLVMNFTLP